MAVGAVVPASVVTQSAITELLKLLVALGAAEGLFCQAQLRADSEEQAAIKISVLFIIIKIAKESSYTPPTQGVQAMSMDQVRTCLKQECYYYNKRTSIYAVTTVSYLTTIHCLQKMPQRSPTLVTEHHPGALDVPWNQVVTQAL